MPSQKRYRSIVDRPNTPLGNMFEAARARLGLTQSEVARRTATEGRRQISTSSWTVLTKGGRMYGGNFVEVQSSAEIIKRVAEVLEVDVDAALMLGGYPVDPNATRSALAGVPTSVLREELERREGSSEGSKSSTRRRGKRTATG